MSARHTPGPWSVSADPKSQHGLAWGGYWQIDGEYDAVACNQYCFANTKPEVSAANARLIAAAPELLEACEALLDRYRIMVAADGPECLQAIAAIAKARGAA